MERCCEKINRDKTYGDCDGSMKQKCEGVKRTMESQRGKMDKGGSHTTGTDR